MQSDAISPLDLWPKGLKITFTLQHLHPRKTEVFEMWYHKKTSPVVTVSAEVKTIFELSLGSHFPSLNARFSSTRVFSILNVN